LAFVDESKAKVAHGLKIRARTLVHGGGRTQSSVRRKAGIPQKVPREFIAADKWAAKKTAAKKETGESCNTPPVSSGLRARVEPAVAISAHQMPVGARLGMGEGGSAQIASTCSIASSKLDFFDTSRARARRAD
jgi:hypothetical protein